MANFTIADIKALREQLGTGMVDTKKALEEADGDVEKAVEILRLKGAKGLERYDRNIEKWWRDNRCVLILTWNNLRPADCPVGTVLVPPECLPPKEDTDA